MGGPRRRLRGEVNMVTMATILIVTLNMVTIVIVTLNMVTIVIVTLDMVNLCRLQVKGEVNLLL